jgi:hypothetical protein
MPRHAMFNPQPIRIVGPELAPICARLRHQLTMLSETRNSRPGRHTGLTIWSTSDRSASVYWTWELTDEGCPVLADPLAIRSNLVFGEPGGEVNLDDQLLGINELVRELPWQKEVMEHLARLRLPPAGGRSKRPVRSGRHASDSSRGTALAA